MRQAGDSRISRFNRVCCWGALAWLVGLIGAGQVLRPSVADADQYFMGGLIALKGQWDHLYPVGRPDARYNLGYADQGTVSPVYASLAAEQGIVADANRFIQAPPVALAWSPLAAVGYWPAVYLWAGVLVLCTWGTAVLAGMFYTACRGGTADRGTGLIMLLVATSPLAYRSIRCANISPIVSLAIAVVLLDLIRRHVDRRSSAPHAARDRPALTPLAVAGMIAGFFAKYATPVLVPLHVLTRHWAVLVWSGVALMAIVAATMVFSGVSPFVAFATEVAPTLNRPHPAHANQSLVGFLLRVTGQQSPGLGLKLPVIIGQIAVLALVLMLLWNVRHRLHVPDVLLAGAAALVAWLLIFGPLYWEHYALYLTPFWGWAIVQARQSRRFAILGVLSVVLVYFPFPAFEWARFPEPINSHMLWGTCLLLILALEVLHRARRARREEGSWEAG